MFVTNAKKLVIKYGPEKYGEDIAVVKNLPNLALLRAVNPYTFLIIASQETCEEARGHLELDEVSEKLRPELAAKLRKDWGKLGPSFKELFRHHTEVQEDGQGMRVTFTGVTSELDTVQSVWKSSSWRPSSTKGKNVRKIDVNIDLPNAEPTHTTVPAVTDHVQIEQTAAIPDQPDRPENKRDQVTEGTVDEGAKIKKNKSKKKKKKKRAARPAEVSVEHLTTDNAAGTDDPTSTEATAEHNERSEHGKTEGGSSLSKEGSRSKLAYDGLPLKFTPVET
ncbi:hypothetical protein RvY_17138 [Ramazzottius varieornatus]|uniref:Uncharacterized protein n=1 Tax=Ramazzottius varieornatus TaxID=947166 RepID=A0A1D1W129_RAMVA|nr:hypothetical protein RvY_17138 [Ramazzottius varieornatus]